MVGLSKVTAPTIGSLISICARNFRGNTLAALGARRWRCPRLMEAATGRLGCADRSTDPEIATCFSLVRAAPGQCDLRIAVARRPYRG
jgi:hypothetical protein